MVTMFGDESADETQQRTFAVAGIIASDDIWIRLDEFWRERTSGIPFHATDCESDYGVYSNTPHQENKALYRDLTQILANSGVCGWGAAFDLSSYRETFPAIDQDMCYLRGFINVINFFQDFSQKAYNDTVKFTFDRRYQTDFSAGRIYNLFVSDPANKFLFDEVGFASRKKQTRIQMADLYAYEVMKELDNKIGPVKRERRKSFSALAETERFGADFYLREYFLDMRSKLPELEKMDPYFTREAYAKWVAKYGKNDTPKNRIHFFISQTEIKFAGEP